MNHIKPCDIYGRLTKRYTVSHLVYKEATFFRGPKIVRTRFEFNDKSSWTLQQAKRVAKLLEKENYIHVKIEEVL